MKKPLILDIYIHLTMALMMTFAVACSGPGQLKNLLPQSAVNNDGTTHGGGGNGVNGKVYESYIVNPQALPAYKEILQPKIDSLDRTWMGAGTAASPLFNIFWKFKKWYIAPVSLNTLNKETIGVEFTKEKTEQLALQTDSEIWIDSRLFEKMNHEEQAQVLMHEYVMSLYLFKFESLYDLCMIASTHHAANSEDFRCGTVRDLNKIAPAESSRELEKSDYSHIRYVTSTLMEKGTFGSKLEISNLFLINEFDRRIFNNDEEKKREDVDLQANEVIVALKRISYSQALNGPCFGVQSGVEKNCTFEVKDAIPVEGAKSLEITLKESSTRKALRSFVISISNIRTSRTVDGSIISENYWAPMPWTEGALTDGLYVELEKYKDNPASIKNIFFVRNIVFSVTTEPGEELRHCKEIVNIRATYIKTTLFEQDVIYLGSADKESRGELRRALYTGSESKCIVSN